jgi:hypothetical protein
LKNIITERCKKNGRAIIKRTKHDEYPWVLLPSSITPSKCVFPPFIVRNSRELVVLLTSANPGPPTLTKKPVLANPCPKVSSKIPPISLLN